MMKFWFCYLRVFVTVVIISQTEGDICVKDEFDYIVVGLGSAGAPITARLSEDEKVKVLALDVGKEPDEIFKIPYFIKFTQSSYLTTTYFTTKQECCRIFKNQKPTCLVGKALGGTSSINTLQYNRGCKRDFDNWLEQGNEGWAYDDVFPYFLKLEDYRIPHSPYDAKYYNKSGPIGIELAKYSTFMKDAFLRGASELNYSAIDLLGEFTVGFANGLAMTMKNGERSSAYSGYIQPVLSRANMRIEAKATVTKILVDSNKKVTGVTYMKNGQYCNVTANKEVIISAGVINTPKLLMLSGIGPNETLKEHKIPLVHNVPGVGQNFHDQCGVMIFISVNQSLPYTNLLNIIDGLNLYQKSRTGLMTSPYGSEGLGLISSGLNTHPEDWPDLEFYLMTDDLSLITLAPNYNKTITWAFVPRAPNKFTVIVSIQRPKSRGYVTLLSNNIADPPVINPAYLTEDLDINVLAKGIDILHQLVNTKAMQQYGAKIADKLTPDCDSKSLPKEEYFKCLALSLTMPSYYAGGTCKMGPDTDTMAVVDNRLRIRGLTGIRVADASIMPTVPVAHINAPVIMIGEKAADMIKEDNK